jgi:hypothetical protein
MDVTPEALEATQSAQDWLTDNFSRVRDEYSGEFIAIKDDGVKASAPDTDELEASLNERGIDTSDTLITYIRERGQVVIR